MPGYDEILRTADGFFRRVSEEQPQALSCGLGCTLCCHGLFEISAADLSVLAAGLDALDEQTREATTRRAESIMKATDHPILSDCSPREKEAFFERAEDIPCPALGEGGRCLVYTSRPLVCRTFGLPLREGEKFIGEECELNFHGSTDEERRRAAWDLEWEDVLGPDDEMTIPEAIVRVKRLRGW